MDTDKLIEEINKKLEESKIAREKDQNNDQNDSFFYNTGKIAAYRDCIKLIKSIK